MIDHSDAGRPASRAARFRSLDRKVVRPTGRAMGKAAAVASWLGIATIGLLAPAVSAAERRVPDWPPSEGKIRVVIDTDAANEIDDQFAIALALLSQERLDIEGFVGAHFGDAGGPDGVERSVREIHTLLEKAGMAGRFPVLPGAPPFQYSAQPVEAPGVDFIIERAMAADETSPLWIVLLGPCTDVVSAHLKEPAIADRVVVFWHGRTRWPDTAWNFNAYNDLKAVRSLFAGRLPFVLFDTGTYLRCPMAESAERIAPFGALGRYLHEFRYRREAYRAPHKGFFDLGDIAALVDPSLVDAEIVDAPSVTWDMKYDHGSTHGGIVRIYQIERDRTFELLYEKLREAFPRSP